MSRQKQADQWVRTFQVIEPTRHQKGYTVYKVISKITVWKRYNDFKKLHKELQKIHAGLHLKGTFPTFAKSKFIGRFEPDIIEERRKCALDLLEFAAKFPPLFTSRVFVGFLEGGIKVEVNELDSLKEEPLQPQSVATPPQTAEASASEEKAAPELGGIWKFPQVPDTISVSSEDSDERTTFTDTDSTLSGVSLPTSQGSKSSMLPQDMLMFDPLLEDLQIRDGTAGDSTLEQLNSVILENPAQNVTSAENPIGNVTPTKSDESFQTRENYVVLGEDYIEVTVPSQEKGEQACWMQEEEDSSSITTSVDDPKSEDVEPSSECAYLFEAAGHISHGQVLESEGDYMKAVKQYNTGISILLRGVQDDEDIERKEAVRRKTKKYLRRAKQLYQKHANSQGDCTSLSFLSPLRRPISELRLFKVLGVLASSVVLVMHPSADNPHVIKVVRKSHTVNNELHKNTELVRKIPFMVELESYFETESALYLVLQHASGGRLWDYVEDYLNSNSGTPIKKRTYSFGHEPLSNYMVRTSHIQEAPPEEEEPKQEKDSYLDVFADYVDSLDESKCLSLAKCNFGQSKKGEQAAVGKEELAPQNHVTEDAPQQDEELSDSGISDSGITNSCEQASGLLPGVDVETAELIANAQKLLEDIDRTLKETRVQETEVKLERKPEPLSRSRKSSAADKRRSERKARRSSSVFERQSSIESCESPTPDGLFPLPPKTHTPSRLLDSPSSRPLVAVYLPEAVVRRWGAEIITAVDMLHRYGIICRDLNPDNILLGSGGSVLLSYFGNLPGTEMQTRISDVARNGLYVAPEIHTITPVTQVADWWSVGALLYELLTGKSLSACHPGGIWPYTELNLPGHLSSDARSLLTELLRYDQRERLSNIEHLRMHPFFLGIDWDSMQLAAY